MSRLLLVGSAAFLLLIGVACLFLPEETAAALGLAEGAGAVMPITGAGALGFASVNWTGRGAIYGGIYGKPIVLGNFTFAAIATLTLFRATVAEPSMLGWAVVAGFLAYWVAFIRLLYWPPFEDRGREAREGGARGSQ